MNIRDWSCCKCGSGWMEEIGKIKLESGETENLYCTECKERTNFEHCIRDSDDTEDLSEPAFICSTCKRLLPAIEKSYEDTIEVAGTKDIEDITTYQCHDCNAKQEHNHQADMDAQDIKWGKGKI